MAFQKIQVHIRGLVPLIMHNGQLADPTNEIVREIKKITAKGKKKTDADQEELARLEWIGSLYVNESGAIVVPGENIEAMVGAAARKSRRGKESLAGLLCEGMPVLIYDGPKDMDALWANRGFRKSCGARVGQARVFRTRPMFRHWELEFELGYRDDLINRDEVCDWLVTAGSIIGLCDWRPKFGRYEVVKAK